MTSSKPARHRHSLRLPDFNYTSPGAYFVTLPTYQRQNLFGEIQNNEMIPNELAIIATREWNRLPERFAYVSLDAFVVMPNHIHFVIVFNGRDVGVGAQQNYRCAPTPGITRHAPVPNTPANVMSGSLGAVVRAYKSSVAFQAHKLPAYRNYPVWQRNYHEHIIRNQREWDTIRNYIFSNPQNWENDTENSHHPLS